MIALPMLLTNALLRLAVKDNSMLKDKFTVPGTMTSSLPSSETSPEVTGSGRPHCDNYLLSHLLYAFSRSQGMARIQVPSVFHFKGLT